MAVPKVGVRAELDLRDWEQSKRKYNQDLRDMESQTKRAARSINSDAKGMGDAFRSTAKGMDTARSSTNALLDRLDGLRERTQAHREALLEQRNAMEGSSTAITALTLGTAAAVTATIAIIKTINDSVKAYEELGREVRRVQLELGVSTQEASAWVEVAKRAGVSTSTFNRAMASLSRNIVNYRIDQLSGQESTNNFAKALSALDISVEKVDGSLKSASDVFTELQQRAQELGPGVATLGELSNALGFSTRQLVEVLFDESLSLKAVQDEAFFLGTILTELDKKQTRELTDATNDLRAAQEGLGNTIARITAPAVENLKRQQAGLTTTFRFVIAGIKGFIDTQLELVGTSHTMEQYQKTLRDNIAKYAFGLDEATEKEAESERQRNTLTQETLVLAEAERRLADERQKTIEQLDELNTRLDQRIADVNTRFDRQLEDLDIKSGRARIDRNIKLSNSLEDIYLRRERRLRDVQIKQQNDALEIGRQFRDKLEDFEKDAARARERIAVRHRENLIKIENRYFDTVDEAARDNDTVAVVRAIRQRNRQLRDETRRFSVEQDELDKDLKLKRDKISEDAERRKRDRQVRDAEEKAAIERKFRDEIDALIRKNNRDITLTRLHEDQKRADVARARQRALDDQILWYQREEAVLRAHLNTLIGMYQSYLNRAFTGGGRSLGGGFTSGTPTVDSGGTGILYDWMRGGRPQFRAEGGVDVVNRPTTFVAGEAGAEIAAFIPLSGSQSIEHNFGKLPIEFSGIPGGMDTSAVQSIVYSAMVELARALGSAKG